MMFWTPLWFNFVLQAVLVAQHKAIVVPFQFEFTVPAAAASVGAGSEHQHDDYQPVLYVQCDHGEVH